MAKIVVDTSLDVNGLDKELADVEKKIEKTKDSIGKKKLKVDADTDRAAKLGAELDVANAELAKLEEQAKSMHFSSVEEAEAFPSRLAEAQARVKALTSDFNKADSAAERSRDALELIKDVLKDLEVDAGELGIRIKEQADNENEFVKAAKKAGEKAGTAFDYVGKRIKALIKRVLFFSLITKLLSGVRSYFSDYIKQNDEASAAIGRLKGALQTLAQPLLEALIPVFVTIIDWITRAITALSQLIAMLTGKTLRSFQKAAKSSKKASSGGGSSGGFASFDTINQLTSGGGGGASGELEAVYDAAELSDSALKGILATIALIGSAIAAWQLAPKGGELKMFIGLLMMVAGAVSFVKGAMDAWNKGVSLDNVKDMLLGVILLASGAALAFGEVGAGIALLVTGIVMLVLGFKDVIENGATLQNTLLVIAGIIATGLGIAFLAGSIIPLLVAAILGIVYAIVAVGGEAEGLAKGIKTIFEGIIKFIKGVFTGDWKMAWAGVKDIFKGIWNSILSIAGGVFNAIIKGINFLVDKINSIQITIPDWVPGLGGKGINFNIPHAQEWKVPYLAQGAVIPPNRQFMAVLGDQKSGTNVEAPLETIEEAVRRAQGNMTVVLRCEGSTAQLIRLLAPEIAVEFGRTGIL